MAPMQRLTLAHSPDPDDAFMWWALSGTSGSCPIDTEGFEFDIILDDIQSLNEKAMGGEFDITAISCAQYPFVADRYAITACGASFGENYGPKLVARHPISIDELRAADCPIAVPGLRTTAALLASMILGSPVGRLTPVPFDVVAERVAAGDYQAGVVIHEGQLTFADLGLHLVADVGAWWFRATGLPLPLGLNVMKRDLATRLDPGSLQRVVNVLERSIRFALDHRDDAVAAVMPFARGITPRQADEFIGMYVNRFTLDCGADGRKAVQALLEHGYRAGVLPPVVGIDIISPPR